MKKYQTINESIRESIIQLDAIGQEGTVGVIFVDILDGKVVTAYFETELEGQVHELSFNTNLMIILDGLNGITYHAIKTADIFNTFNDMGNPLFAGMRAIVSKKFLINM